MPKLALLSLLLVFSLKATLARAGGDELLNGGDAVVCMRDGHLSYELLDLAEGRNGRRYTYRSGETEEQVVRRIFSQLIFKDPARACLFQRWLAEFNKESEVKYKTELRDVQDEGPYNEGARCWIKQVALRTYFAIGSKRYFINGDIYSKFSPLDRVGLRLHELVYREARFINPTGFSQSSFIRRYIGYIFSEEMSHQDSLAYESLVREVALPVNPDYCNPNNIIFKIR